MISQRLAGTLEDPTMKPQKQVKTGPMPQTPCTQDQLAKQAQQQAQINGYRPKFTNGSAAKGK